MFHQIKKLIRKLTPKFVLSGYHFFMAHVAAIKFGRPSEKLIIIGVTGTKGKSTTANLIAKIFDEAGMKSALTSTVNFKIGDSDKLNNLKMTMPGRFFIQNFLTQAIKANCKVAIIESSSEGILQHRQIGIHYDAMVFTNLTPEHIESHGGFENYKNAKLKYFINLEKLPTKIIDGKKIKKCIAFNFDDKYGNEFSKFKVDEIISFGTNQGAKIKGTNFVSSPDGISFDANGTKFNLKLKGNFDLYNSLAAIALCTGYEINLDTAKAALEKILMVPGRMESIENRRNIKIIVDYSYEPESINQLYETIKSWPKNRIIHLLGSTGGGRDTGRRKILGNVAGKNADIVIVTNEDPYDDDPQQIIHDVADGAVEVGKVIKENLFREPDRRKAIAKALNMGRVGDLILITGKGSEQKMAVKGGYIPWDDRQVVREELNKLV